MSKKPEPINFQNDDALIRHMRVFRDTEMWHVLVNLWRKERELYIAAVKKKHDDFSCGELSGFDFASTLIERWANKNTKEDAEKQIQRPFGDDK